MLILSLIVSGRQFGNQVETLLRALEYTKTLNRTLVVTPFLDYNTNKTGLGAIPYDELFNITFVRVVDSSSSSSVVDCQSSGQHHYDIIPTIAESCRRTTR